jgi:hypothetical protein
LERESSLHLSEVFRNSDLPKSPVPTGGDPGVQLADFLETAGSATTSRLAGVRKWIQEKLDEQEDNDNTGNSGNRSKHSLPQDDDTSERDSVFNESSTQIRAANLPPGGGAWIPPPSAAAAASQQM